MTRKRSRRKAAAKEPSIEEQVIETIESVREQVRDAEWAGKERTFMVGVLAFIAGYVAALFGIPIPL